MLVIHRQMTGKKYGAAAAVPSLGVITSARYVGWLRQLRSALFRQSKPGFT